MKIAIFDVDGTLVNTHDGIVHTIQDVLQEFGLSYAGDYDRWIGPPVKKSFMEFCGLDETSLWQYMVTSIGFNIYLYI